MPNSVTITGNLGPGNTVTALVFSDVTSVNFDFVARTVAITDKATGTPKTVYFEYANIATVTFSISGANTTVTIST
jgi:hypothetical protein